MRLIVEEKERLGALAHQVIDAHGDQVDPDRRVSLQGPGDGQLGPDPVR